MYIFFSASPSELLGHRIVLFSYGSGLASAMFSIKITNDSGPKFNRLLENLSNIRNNLESRVKVSPEEFDKVMKLREETHNKGEGGGSFEWCKNHFSLELKKTRRLKTPNLRNVLEIHSS